MKTTKQTFLFCFFGSALICTIAYIILHEAGHCIVAAACGAKITDFSILNARMSYTGGTFTRVTESLLNAGGVLFPLFFAVLLLFIFRRENQGLLYRCAFFIMVLVCTAALLAWALVPFVSLFSAPPAGDDVTKFLAVSGLPPLLVLACALILFGLMVLFAVKRGLIRSYITLIREVRAS